MSGDEKKPKVVDVVPSPSATSVPAPPSSSDDPAPAPPSSAGNAKICYNCGKVCGYFARDCPFPRAEGKDMRIMIRKERLASRRCFNCGKIGHISTDCPKPAGNKSCYNCGLEGHIAKHCPNATQD